MNIFESIKLPGETSPEPPRIDAHGRCSECQAAAHPSFAAAADRITGPDAWASRCQKIASCHLYVIRAKASKKEPPPKAKSKGTICAKTGKIRYESQALADVGTGFVEVMLRRQRARPNRTGTYKCSHCKGWHASKNP